jgi:hypothetical protein
MMSGGSARAMRTIVMSGVKFDPSNFWRENGGVRWSVRGVVVGTFPWHLEGFLCPIEGFKSARARGGGGVMM